MFRNIIFLIVLSCLLMHLLFYFKTSKNIDIVYCDNINSKGHLEKLLRLKQPLVLKCPVNQTIIDTIDSSDENVLIKKKNDNTFKKIKQTVICSFLGENKGYYSEHNYDFIEEKIDNDVATFLKPKLSVNTSVDYILLTKDSDYPIKRQCYDVSVIQVLSGKCDITVFTPNNDFSVNRNNMLMEQTIEEKDSQSSKRRVVTLEKNDCLSIPPHWYVKIEAQETTKIIKYNYNTVFSLLGNIHNVIPHMLDIYNKDKLF